jgi:valyl-tRNA synthetase
MSKSLGNSPDPLDLIEKYGADGVRIGLLSMAPNGQDILFSEDRVAQGKKLCTKLWNSFRFRQQKGMEGERSSIAAITGRMEISELEADDVAILGKLLQLTDEFDHAMDGYEFNRAVHILHNFFWNDYCDWYIEISKSRMSGTILAVHDLILRQLLLLFHPFIPFITEELWHGHGYGEKCLGEEHWESGDQLRVYLSAIDFRNIQHLMREIESVQELVIAARGMKAKFGLSASRDVKFYFQADADSKATIERHLREIKHLLLTQFFDETEGAQRLPTGVVTLGSIYMEVEGLDIGAEKARLSYEIERLTQLIEINRGKLSDGNFLARAPGGVIEGARNLLAENTLKKAELEGIWVELSRLDGGVTG